MPSTEHPALDHQQAAAMIPLLLAAAFGMALIILLVILWRYADRRIALAFSDDAIADLKTQLDQLLEAQHRLTTRVENLEAIVTTQTWDALHEKPAPEADPSIPNDLSDEERAARPAKRQRNR